MAYADKLRSPYAVFMGEDEVRGGVVTCKDMRSGEQTALSAADTLERIKEGLARRESGRIILG